MSIKRLIATCSLIFLGAVAFVSWYAYPLIVLEGTLGAAISISGLFEDTTYFSSGYNNWGFIAIKPGMSPDQVRNILGSPLNEYPVRETGETGWLYSWKRRNTSYHVRCVLFKNGVVSRRLSEYYVD